MFSETQKGKSSKSGVILVILSVMFWGISFISTKVLLEEYPPVSIAFFRQLVAIVPLSVLFVRKKAYFRLSLRVVLHMAVATLFGIVLYFVFENSGMKYISASEASIIVATIPVFTLLIDSAVSRKRLELRTLALILCSWVGVYLVISAGGKQEERTGNIKGSLLVFGAMVSWIVYTLITKKLSERYNSLQMTSIQTLLSIPLFIPFIWSERTMWHLPSWVALIHLIFLGVFCSALAYVFFLNGISVLGPAVASSYLNLIPLVTLVTGALFLNEKMDWVQLAGAFLILASLGLISFFNLTHKSLENTNKE